MQQAVAPRHANTKNAPSSKPRPWGRLLVGLFPGYISATFVTSAFTSLLPIHRSEASLLGLILVGLTYAAMFVYAFAAPGWVRALRDIGLMGAVGAIVLALMKLVFAA